MTDLLKATLVILIFWTAPLFARWMTIQEAGTVVENFYLDFTVLKNGASTQTMDYTVRVQGEDAKVSASLFQIDYNALTDKVEILEAYTLNGKEKIPVEPSGIEDRDKGESKAYDAMKIRSVVFPQVQIGSKIHVRYSVTTSKPIMENRWSNDVTLSPSVFVEKFRLTVKSEVPIYFDVEDPHSLLVKKQKDKFNVEFTNKKVLQGWVHAEKEPYFHPSGFANIWLSTHKSWTEFYEGFDKDIAAVLNAPLPRALKPWVEKAKKNKDQKQQILALMGFMSHDFRYFGDWRRHDGGIVPRPLAEIEKSRYGDCKDLASLLVAMLRQLKIDANVALVRRGENAWGHEPDYKLPNMSHFNHAIVQAKVGAEVLWLDATNPVSSLEPFPDIAGRPAWILEPGKGHFERLPEAVSTNFVHFHDYEYNFKSIDAVNVMVNAHLTHMAPYHIANELLMAPRSEVLSDTLEYFTEGQAVHSFKYIKEPQTGRALADMNLAIEYQAGRVTFHAGKDAFFVIPDGFLAGAFYETETRESDIRLADSPFLFHATRRLKNTKLVQDRPEPCKLESEWMNLDRKIAVEGKDVVIYQDVNLKKPFITRAEYRSPAFKKLQMATRTCFYHSGVLVESLTGTL